eukprot:3378050-Karenia_brevis.AAC.1
MRCLSRTQLHAGHSHHMCCSSSSARPQKSQTGLSTSLALARRDLVQTAPANMLRSMPLKRGVDELKFINFKVENLSTPCSTPRKSRLVPAAFRSCARRKPSRTSCCQDLAEMVEILNNSPQSFVTVSSDGHV